MQKIHYLILAGLFVLSLPALAVAEQAMHGQQLKNAMGEHVMTGTITKIDKSKGTLSLSTAEAPLDLHFPPAAIQSLHKGDRVAVQLAISTDASAANVSEKDENGGTATGHQHKSSSNYGSSDRSD